MTAGLKFWETVQKWGEHYREAEKATSEDLSDLNDINTIINHIKQKDE
jgi:hypothetical protein